LAADGVVPELVKVLRDLDIFRVKRKSVFEGCTFGDGIAANAIFGSGLNECRDRMAACQLGCQAVVVVGGVKHGGALEFALGIFELLLLEQFACIEKKLDGAATIAVARLWA
jgi:hypothetical protein